MSELDVRDAPELGQAVRHVADPAQRTGYIVAIMLVPPYSALVRWRGTEPTFEGLDDLVEVSSPSLS
jgi:hypothetical protein